MQRNKTQKDADALDRDIHRLIGKATDLNLFDVAAALARARIPVRRLMHPEDVKKTA